MQARTTLLPARWLVQPKVVAIHVLRDPYRAAEVSVVAEQDLRRISTYQSAPNCDRGRMLAVSMQPPRDESLRILRHILVAGDRRYWSWTATKPQANNKIRNSLMWELGLDRGNLSRGLGPLLEDGVLKIEEKQHGREVLSFNDLGRLIFAELRWRWMLREAATEFLEPLADSYGWQELSTQVGMYMLREHLDPTRRADIIFAAKEQLKAGVEDIVTLADPAVATELHVVPRTTKRP